MARTQKTTRPMIGNPSVEYIAGYMAWGRGETLDKNPYVDADRVSAQRWRRGWNYAEAGKRS